MTSSEANPDITEALHQGEGEADEVNKSRGGRLPPVVRARIIAVAEKLEREGLPVSTNRVRDQLGKHSFSTIQMVIEEWKASRATKVTESEVLPPDVPGAQSEGEGPPEERGTTSSLTVIRALDQRIDQKCLALEQRIAAEHKEHRDDNLRAIATAEEVLNEIRSLREDHRTLRNEQQRDDRSRIENLLRSTHRAQQALFVVSGVMLVLLGAVVWLVSHHSTSVPIPGPSSVDAPGAKLPAAPSEAHVSESPPGIPTPTSPPPAPPPASTHADKPDGPSGKETPGPSTDIKGGGGSSVNDVPSDAGGKPGK
jgi:hypothetical protein